MEIDLKEETDDEETDEEILLTFSGPKLIYYEHSYVKNFVALCEMYNDCVLDSENVSVSPESEEEENQVPVRRSQRQINKLERDVSTSVPDNPDTVQLPIKPEEFAEVKSKSRKEQNEVNAQSSPKNIKKSEQDAAVSVLDNANVVQSPIKSEMCLEVKIKPNMEQNILPIRRSQRQINKSEQVVPASALNEQDVKQLPLKSEMCDELKNKENVEQNEVPVRRSQRQINKSEQDVPVIVLDKTDVIQPPVKNEMHVDEKSKADVEQKESNASTSNSAVASPIKNRLSKNGKKLVDVAVCLEKLHSDQLSPSKINKKVKISDTLSFVEKKVETSLKRKLSGKDDLVAIGRRFKEKCVTDSSPVKTRRKRANSEPSKDNLNLPNVCAIDKDIIKIKKERRSPKQISCLGKTKLPDRQNINLSSFQKKKRRMSAPSDKIDIIKNLKKPSDVTNNGKQKNIPSTSDHVVTTQSTKIKNLSCENKGPVAKGVANTSPNSAAKPKFKKAFRKESLRLVINEDEPALFSQPDVMVKIKSEDTLKKDETNESEVKDPSPNYECSEDLSKIIQHVQTPEKVQDVEPAITNTPVLTDESRVSQMPDEASSTVENLESDAKELAKDSSACEQDDMKDLDSENSLHIDESIDKNMEGENQEVSMKNENMNDSVAGSFEIEDDVIKDSAEEKPPDETLNPILSKPVDSKQDLDSDKPIAERRPRRNVKKKEFFEDVAMRSSAQSKKSADKLKASNKISSEDDSKDGKRKSSTKTEVESEGSSEEEEEEEDDPTKLWCICRQPHNNRFMIECDLCEEWFHGSCVGITRQQGRKMEKQQIDWLCPTCQLKSTDKSDAENNVKLEPKEKKVKLEIKETNTKDRNPMKDLSLKKESVADKVNKFQTKMREDKCGSSSHSNSISKSDIVSSSNFLNKKSFNKNSDRNVSKGNDVPSNVKKGLKEPLRKKQNCITCQAIASVNSCYCSDKCLEKHANDCLAIMREGKKGLKGSEFDSQKIVVLDRIRSNVIADDNAPTACNIISWLKANPNFMIVCSPSLSTTKHSVQRKEVDSTTAIKDKKVSSDDTSKATVRCNVQKTLKNILMDRCKNADDIKLPEDDICKIAVKIEEELNSLFKDNAFKYRAKYRSLMFNIKDPRNQGLFRKILKGNIPPDKLVRMSPEELASMELAKWREQENQHSLDMIKRVQLEQQSGSGLLLKKTHKGEVEIEDDFSMIDDTTKVSMKSFSAEPVESEKPETDKEVAKDTTHHHRSHLFDLNCKICTGKILPPPVEDKTPKKIRVAHSISIDLNSPAAFDDIEKNVARIVDKKSPLSSAGDDSMDQEPTSTVSIGSPEIAVRFSLESDGKVASSVWKGFIFMQDVAKFVTSAYKVSGPTEFLCMDVPDTIQVCGRIIPDQVFDYLGKIKQSGNKELIIVRFQAANAEETVSYNSFYSYLSSRKRYGVVGNHSKKIKDFYILPLAATSPVPIVLMPFDGPGLPSPRTHLLLGVIIRHKDKQPALPLTKVEKPKEDRLDDSYTPPLETRSYTPPLETRSYTPPLPPLQMDNSLTSDVYSPSVDLKGMRELVQNPVSSSEDVKMEDSDIYEPSYTPPFQMLPESPKDEDKPYDPEQDILMMETDENNSKSRSKEDINKSTSAVDLEKNKKILDALTRQMEETDRQVNVLKQLISHPEDSDVDYQSPSTQALDINSVAGTGMSSFLDLPKNLQDLLNVVREKSLGNENGSTGEKDVDMRINNLFNKSFNNSGHSGINEFDKAANVLEKNMSPEATPPLEENDESASAVVRPSDPRIKIRASFQESPFLSEETSSVSLSNMSATELVEKAEKELAEMNAIEKTQNSSQSVPLSQEKSAASNINKIAPSCWNQFKEPPPPGIEPSDLEAQDSSYLSKSTSSTSDNQPHPSPFSPLIQNTQQIGPHFPPPSQFPPPLPPGFSIQTPPPNIKNFPPPNVISTFFPPPPPPPLPIVTKANDESPMDKTWPSWNVPPQQPKDSNWQFGEPQCDKNWKPAQETVSLDSSSSSSHYYPSNNRDFNKDQFYRDESSSERRWNRPRRFTRNTWHKRPARGGHWRGKSFHFNKNQQK